MSNLTAIQERLSDKGLADVNGLPNETAFAWLITKLTPHRIARSGILLLAADERSAEIYRHALDFWFDQSADKRLPIHPFSTARSVVMDSWMRRRSAISIVTLADSTCPLPAPAEFEKLCLTIKIGDTVKPTQLARELSGRGYDRDTHTFDRGQFSSRGEIFEVFTPQYELPLRLSFDNNRIDRIEFFQPLSGRSNQTTEPIQLLPLELPTDSTEHIWDYLSEKVLICGHETMMSIPPQRLSRLVWRTFAAEEVLSAGFSAHVDQPNDPRDLKDLLDKKKDWHVFVPALDKEQLPVALAATNTTPPWVQSCQHEEEKLLILNRTELKHMLPVENRTTEHRALSENEFSIGDYVVHLDHGIGLFTGITTRDFAGGQRDFFCIDYAEGDKLYVPVERIDKVTAYVGLTKPTLHRLSGTSWTQTRLRIKKETLVTAQRLLSLYAARQTAVSQPITQHYPEEDDLAHDFPYQETPDQLQALRDVWQDLATSEPMDRLICGDVGFGKTEIALRTAFKIVLSGKQVALLAPTTILAQQHLDTFTSRLKKYGVRIELLTRFQSKTKQQELLAELARGHIDIIIGTHRLLSNDVICKNLGLVIIDEEQKFGVLHKEKLKQYRHWVHVLTLSATPIPRTLYFSLTNIKPVSLITTPPLDRKPIKTIIRPFSDQLITSALEQELDRHGQSYYLYNQVESIDVKAEQLRRLLPRARIGVAHGQMTGERLATVMHEFDTGRLDILVCSTIIENGLDLPNVNTLIVEQAPRFGLAQLYQLRGRIGRSHQQAFAYLLYSSAKLPAAVAKRMRILEAAQELGQGFRIARHDLELRGIGNLLGKKQHGQTAAVGLNLYLRLLEQAVDELQTGQTVAPENDISIELPEPYGIPETLVKNQTEKFSLYQRLARLNSIAQLDRFVAAKFPRQQLPTEFSNLITLLKIKIRARQAQLNSIEVSKNRHDTWHIRLTAERSPLPILEKINKLDWPTFCREQTIKTEIPSNIPWQQALLELLQLLS